MCGEGEAGSRVHKQLVVFQGHRTRGQQLASTYLLLPSQQPGTSEIDSIDNDFGGACPLGSFYLLNTRISHFFAPCAAEGKNVGQKLFF